MDVGYPFDILNFFIYFDFLYTYIFCHIPGNFSHLDVLIRNIVMGFFIFEKSFASPSF
jgi:hypothetical protein